MTMDGVTAKVSQRLHVDEVETDPALVKRLLTSQFPQWRDLPIEPVATPGAECAVYRLGDDMAVRLPRVGMDGTRVQKLRTFLPRLGPSLPLEIPRVLGWGTPSAGFPWPWYVVNWIAGEDASRARVEDWSQAGADLGRFVAALHIVDPNGGPPPGKHNGLRGAPVAANEAEVRWALGLLGTDVDAGAVEEVWQAALGAPPWQGAPVWIHGDLTAVNVLVREGRLAAVIDFGCCGVGDPAYDVRAAWAFLPAEARERFRAEARADEPTWTRARGLALSWGLAAWAYYRTRGHVLAGLGKRAVDEVLAERRGNR
jgi:aminoglycoside phosphotransferase (APT) family kinase protein